VKVLGEIADFVRKLRRQMRFGELSRAPLRLLRFEMRGDEATCEWTARPPDSWDADLSAGVREQNEALQALRDAVQVRELLFSVLPEVQSAHFRVYRRCGGEPPELIITGALSRDDEPPANIPSLAMRAKLYGLHFILDDGSLQALQTQEHDLEIAT
jgi:hypothetical protein